MIWYSYWIRAKGYGATSSSIGDPRRLGDRERRDLHGWLRQLTLDNTVAVVGTFIVTIAFLVLGTELLGARGLVPEENQIAERLGHLLGGVWGRAGFWFMVLGVFVGFWDTVLSDQDGFGRMFASGTRILAARRLGRFADEVVLFRSFVVVLVTVLPIVVYLVVGNPVTLLKVAGGIEAAHIPLLAVAVSLPSSRLPTSSRRRRSTCNRYGYPMLGRPTTCTKAPIARHR